MHTLVSGIKETRVVLAAVGATLITIFLVHGFLGPAAGGHDELRRSASSTPATGTLYTGSFNGWGTGPGYFGDRITLPATMAYDIAGNRFQYVVGTAYTTQCPGLGKVKSNGYLCLYVKGTGNASLGGVFHPPTAESKIARTGFSIYWSASGSNGAWAYGQWALRVGSAGTAPQAGTKTARLRVPAAAR